jgi:uncharacterized membrane protein
MWLSGIFIEWAIPYIEELIYVNLAADKAYSLVCHQDSEKLITSGIFTTKVCARCTGIYSGVVISILVLLIIKFKKNSSIKYLFIASIPILLDIIFYNTGIYSYSKTISFVTGILFGSTGFFYIASGIDKFIYELESTKT